MRDACLYSPSDQLLYERQISLEEQTINTAVDRYKKFSADATTRGDVAGHRAATHLLHAWFGPLTLAIRASQTDAAPLGAFGKRLFGAKPVDKEINSLLTQLPSDAIAVIAIHSILGTLMKEPNGVPLTQLAFHVANVVRAEINLKKICALEKRQQKVERDGGEQKRRRPPKTILNNALKSSSTVVSAVNYAAQQIAVRGSSWSQKETLLLGIRLIDLVMSVAKVEVEGKLSPAIHHFKKFRRSDMVTVGMLQLTDSAMTMLSEEAENIFEVAVPKQQPMLVRPRPWTSATDGAFLRTETHLVRTHNMPLRGLNDALAESDLSVMFEGLNALGDQPWRVNSAVLHTAEELWARGGGIAGLVTRSDYEVPSKREFMAAQKASFEEKKKAMQLQQNENVMSEVLPDENLIFDEKKAAKRLRLERKKAQKLNRELISMRADTTHRLSQARKFAPEDQIFLPHNVDFRGRAYPIPVHLQHMGCDLTRALLTFSGPGELLGDRGVYWLKIHLANLLGGGKLSFEERFDMGEASISKAVEVCNNPFSDENLEWWSSAEDPFQLLAACSEISAAVGRHGGEAAMRNFKSTLPVSMDGSCNGLQHYAALGRDVAGGIQVNLVPNTRPQDVYSGIAKLVNSKVDRLAENGDEIAKALQGKISRKVVKQTVMTSVYGVTLVGAREQIVNRLAEIEGFPEEKLFAASMKLASLTLSSLDDIFCGASQTMEWLYESASRISKTGHQVQWITPVGLPVIQPYRQRESMVIKTLMQRVTLDRNQEHTPVSSARQRSAFAPNFVHSIDASHMLLTAVACRKEGMCFAAVHDSFWTSAASVDRMNEILRNEFVKLHQRDLLVELREGFKMRYADVTIPETPPRGELDLDVVRHSPYFFS